MLRVSAATEKERWNHDECEREEIRREQEVAEPFLVDPRHQAAGHDRDDDSDEHQDADDEGAEETAGEVLRLADWSAEEERVRAELEVAMHGVGDECRGRQHAEETEDQKE